MNKIFGADTLFARFMNKLWDIIWTGMLFFMASIPLVTMGAASCAAYQCMVKIVRGKSTGVMSFFFEVFKDNIKATLLLKIVGILFSAWIVFDCVYLYGYGTDFSKTLSIIIYVVAAIYLMFVSYLYPLISRFDESKLELFKLALYLTFRYLHLSIASLLVLFVSIYAVYLMPWSIMIMPGIYWYLVSFPLKNAISRIAGEGTDEEEQDEENEDVDIEINIKNIFAGIKRRDRNPWRKKEEADMPEEAETNEEPEKR